MATKRDDGESIAEARRKARLSERLRANLQRRKAQARSRRAGEADDRPEGLGSPQGDDQDEAE